MKSFEYLPPDGGLIPLKWDGAAGARLTGSSQGCMLYDVSSGYP